MEHIANITVGSPEVSPSRPSHVPGVREGNWPNQSQEGLEARGPLFRASARRSTGINPGAREPIDPRSPHLSPA